jgi:hypothetical protein
MRALVLEHVQGVRADRASGYRLGPRPPAVELPCDGAQAPQEFARRSPAERPDLPRSEGRRIIVPKK